MIAANRSDLTWAEEEGLHSHHGGPLSSEEEPATTSNGPMNPDAGEPPLKQELADVGDAIMKMCPEDPCPWPTYFTETKPPDSK